MDRAWQDVWSATLQDSLTRWDPKVCISVRYLEYDRIFQRHPLNPLVAAAGVARLLASWARHGLLGLLPGEEVNHRIRYAFCPQNPSGVMHARLVRRVFYHGRELFRDVTNQPFCAGTWNVDAFIRVPRHALPGRRPQAGRSRHGAYASLVAKCPPLRRCCRGTMLAARP